VAQIRANIAERGHQFKNSPSYRIHCAEQIQRRAPSPQRALSFPDEPSIAVLPFTNLSDVIPIDPAGYMRSQSCVIRTAITS
jgi:hypothetical protein